MVTINHLPNISKIYSSTTHSRSSHPSAEKLFALTKGSIKPPNLSIPYAFSSALSTVTRAMTPHKKRRRPTWFDTPPIEVTIRIAVFLSAREHTQSALTFAEFGEHTRRAVAAALDYRLIVDPATHLQAPRWANVFAHSLRHLTISAALPFNAEYVRLVQEPCIHTLSIPPHPEYLDAIAASQTLRHLSVTFVESVLASPGLAPLVKVLSTLRITTLRLLSEASYVPTLFQNLFAAFHSEPPLVDLGKSCSHVQTLHIGVKLWSMRQLLPVLSGFESLRNLTLCGIINTCNHSDQSLADFLRRLDSVQLLRVGFAPRLAVEIGDSITALRHGNMDTCDLQALVVCKNLDVLDLDMKNGQEAVVGQLAKGLRTLRLRWQYRHLGGFYSPEAGVILDIVKSAPRLRDVHLMDVEISLSEASSIMELIGPRLRSFGFPLTCEGQMAVKTLTGLARVGARYNPEIEELCPSAREELLSAHHWGWRPRTVSSEDEERLMRAIHSLHQHAPRLKAGELERLGRIVTIGDGGLRRVSSHVSVSVRDT